jgi:ribulose kinase
MSSKTSDDQSLMVMTNKPTFVSIINSEKLEILQQIIKDMSNEYQTGKMKWLIKHEPFNKFITNELLSESMHFISTGALQLIKQTSSN